MRFNHLADLQQIAVPTRSHSSAAAELYYLCSSDGVPSVAIIGSLVVSTTEKLEASRRFRSMLAVLSPVARPQRIFLDAAFVLAFLVFALVARPIVGQVWAALDGKPLSMATNLMLRFPWLIFVPCVCAVVQLCIDVETDRLVRFWPLMMVFNLFLFTGLAVLWAVGGSASFWRYSLQPDFTP